MPKPVVLNQEQTAMLERLKTSTSQFQNQPALRGDSSAIDAARSLIGEAYELQMPQASYSGLQIYVSMYDTEMDLPERLRNFDRLTKE